MLKTALIFQNHMILQREKKITFWGTTDHSEEITIKVQNKQGSGYRKEDGTWEIEIEPLQTSFKEEVVITSGDEKLVIYDVMVGDVWLAGGQSNMEFFMRYDEDYEKELKQCENPNIRFFDYPEVSYVGQIDEADYMKNFGQWRKANADNLEWFSAVGYYFAKEIQKNQNVPIGIIGCNWGGSPACAWMDIDSIRKGGGQVFIDEYYSAVKGLDLDSYNREFVSNPGNWKINPFEDVFSDLLMRGYSIEEIMKKVMGDSAQYSQMDSTDFLPKIGPKYERRPGGLYESMLCKVAPYEIKGFLYYQGETDGDTHPECYETLFPALIDCWRNLWGEELPFLFVQLAPFGSWMDCKGTPYAIIRQAQQKTSEKIDNVGMAIISDVGMEFDIHPKKKSPVGYRLALQAENKVYNQDVLCEAPTLKKVESRDGVLTLYFENTGDGLHIVETSNSMLTGLKVVTNDTEIDLSNATVQVNKDTVVITDLKQKIDNGKVLLGDGGWYIINLYNSADIPARPAECSF